MKTLVVGLGNPILTDDGVGVKVAYAVQDALVAGRRAAAASGQANGSPTSGVTVAEASVGGLRLMEMMIGFERVILVDALTFGEDPPGTIRRLTLEELRAISPTQHSASAHDTTLVTALETGRRMGLPLPQEIAIFAVAVENVIDFGDQPTPAVAAAIPAVAAAVLQEIAPAS